MTSEVKIPSLLQIAQVLKSNGTEGEVVVNFRDISPLDIEKEEPMFIYDDGLPVPLFIESIRPKGTSKALVKFEGVDSLLDAEELCTRGALYVEEDLYEFEDESSLPDLEGWTLLGEDGEKVGAISGLEDIPGNPCIYVKVPSGEERMIPLHEDLILGMDEGSRTIQMALPEGLI